MYKLLHYSIFKVISCIFIGGLAMNIEDKKIEDQSEEIIDKQLRAIQQDKLASIGLLSAGLAHEINNPLGFVISNFEVLKKYIGIYGEILNEYRKLENLSCSTDSNEIANRIVNLKEIENKKKLQFIENDIPELFNDTSDGLERISKIVKGLRNFAHASVTEKYEDYNIKNGLETTLLIANNEIKYIAKVETNYGELPDIEAIGGQINQVLLNLILNATHAIRERNYKELEGLIKISTYKHKKMVCCEVEDNGTGIPEDVLPHIFVPLFTTKSKGQGTGLGLSISKDIIENRHHGNIRVESKVGQGTKFIIELPVKQ